jgi:hypothetical protein
MRRGSDREFHGMTRHPAYNSWRGMLERCSRPEYKQWKDYGGRGITVCDRWKNSFMAFWEDMGTTWAKGLTIERKDTDKNYEPDNCIWETRAEQFRNTRRNHIIQTPWGPLTVVEAAEKAGLSYMCLQIRLQKKIPYEKLFAPALQAKNEYVFIDTPWGPFTAHKLSVHLNISINKVHYLRKMNRIPELWGAR